MESAYLTAVNTNVLKAGKCELKQRCGFGVLLGLLYSQLSIE